MLAKLSHTSKLSNVWSLILLLELVFLGFQGECFGWNVNERHHCKTVKRHIRFGCNLLYLGMDTCN